MSKERPILFNAEMVNAIMGNRKNVTRRPIKPQPKYSNYSISIDPWEEGITVFKPREWGVYKEGDPPGMWGLKEVIKCPFGQPGDELWVKEDWAVDESYDTTKSSEIPESESVWCKAISDSNEPWDTLNCRGKWRPADHMPRSFSRIQLLVKTVRVERVQDITEEDAKAEGVLFNPIIYGEERPATNGFRDLWNSIYEHKGYGWDVNPWVWVVEFERINQAGR